MIIFPYIQGCKILRHLQNVHSLNCQHHKHKKEGFLQCLCKQHCQDGLVQSLDQTELLNKQLSLHIKMAGNINSLL